jgi:hydrogenase/urease accessory protein HupE
MTIEVSDAFPRLRRMPFLPTMLRLRLRAVFLGLAVLLAALQIPAAAQAHVFKTSEGILFFNREATQFSMQFDMNIEAIMAQIDPELRDTNESPNAPEYNRLRSLPPEELQKIFDAKQDEFLSKYRFTLDGKPVQAKLVKETFREVGDLSKARNTTLELVGDLPPGAKEFRFGWDPSYGKITIRTISVRSKSMHIEVVEKGADSAPLIIDDLKARTVWSMIADFVVIGFEHILPKGLDHILFVVGIFLLSIQLRPILTQITAFTVAHTITLALGALGTINVPASIVEPLIAASIVYVAVENIWRPTLSPWRPAVVFMFGLLHGLGFAALLREFDLTGSNFVIGLLSFNVGVELGQLAVITICFLVVGIWFGNKPWYRQRIVIPGSLFIAAIASYWFVQRVTGWPAFEIGIG